MNLLFHFSIHQWQPHVRILQIDTKASPSHEVTARVPVKQHFLKLSRIGLWSGQMHYLFEQYVASRGVVLNALQWEFLSWYATQSAIATWSLFLVKCWIFFYSYTWIEILFQASNALLRHFTTRPTWCWIFFQIMSCPLFTSFPVRKQSSILSTH